MRQLRRKAGLERGLRLFRARFRLKRTPPPFSISGSDDSGNAGDNDAGNFNRIWNIDGIGHVNGIWNFQDDGNFWNDRDFDGRRSRRLPRQFLRENFVGGGGAIARQTGHLTGKGIRLFSGIHVEGIFLSAMADDFDGYRRIQASP